MIKYRCPEHKFYVRDTQGTCERTSSPGKTTIFCGLWCEPFVVRVVHDFTYRDFVFSYNSIWQGWQATHKDYDGPGDPRHFTDTDLGTVMEEVLCWYEETVDRNEQQ